MNPLQRLVEGRSVSLVGPSPVLLDSGLGKKIDSADVVIRLHAHWPACGPAYSALSDIGTRTDVLMLFADGQKDSRRVSELGDLKLVVWFNGIDHEHLIPVRRYLRAMEIEEMVFNEYYEEDWEYIMAVHAIEAIMKCEPSTLYFCGVDGPLPSRNYQAIMRHLDSRVEIAPHVSLSREIRVVLG